MILLTYGRTSEMCSNHRRGRSYVQSLCARLFLHPVSARVLSWKLQSEACPSPFCAGFIGALSGSAAVSICHRARVPAESEEGAIGRKRNPSDSPITKRPNRDTSCLTKAVKLASLWSTERALV